MRGARWLGGCCAALLVLMAAPAVRAADDLDDGRRAWVLGSRVVVSDGCWSTADQPIVLEARTRQGWTELARGIAVRDVEQCPRAAYPWAVRFAFRVDELGVRRVPGSTARLLELRTRGAVSGDTYFADKLVYRTQAACRAELRDWQCP